jgi:hypothetical protein
VGFWINPRTLRIKAHYWNIANVSLGPQRATTTFIFLLIPLQCKAWLHTTFRISVQSHHFIRNKGVNFPNMVRWRLLSRDFRPPIDVSGPFRKPVLPIGQKFEMWWVTIIHALHCNWFSRGYEDESGGRPLRKRFINRPDPTFWDKARIKHTCKCY